MATSCRQTQAHQLRHSSVSRGLWQKSRASLKTRLRYPTADITTKATSPICFLSVLIGVAAAGALTPAAAALVSVS